MAFRNVTKNPGNEFVVDSLAEIARLPTHLEKGEGGVDEDDNGQVPIGSNAMVKTGEVAVLFPSGWAII